jgi:nucleoid DNA-binding protein
MNREELAQTLCDLDLNLSPENALLVLDTLTGAIRDTLKSGRRVCLSGFGTFQAERLDARRVRNPRVASGLDAFKVVGPRVRYRFKAGAGFNGS